MNPMETDDIVLRKAKFEDWESMHKMFGQDRKQPNICNGK